MRRTALLAAAAVLLAAGRGPANPFRGPVFATPLPGGPGTTLPSGGPLAAPVITPAGTTHGGRQLFEMIPAGWEREPFFTRDPGRYTTGACDNPVACSAVGFVAFDFLLWATQGPSAPPVVTTGPAALGPGIAGAPGAPGTLALLGGARVLNDMRPGFRFDFFLPVAADGHWGVGTRFEMLGQSADSTAVIGTGANVVNVPQVFAVGGLPVPTPVYVSFPGLTAGTATASTQTNFLGGDLTLRRALAAGDAVRLDALVGYRYLHLGDRLSSSWDVFSPAALPPVGPRLMGEDSVRTRNDFHGALLGLGSSAAFGRLTVSGRMAVSLGGTVSERDQSRTRVLFPGATGLGVVAALGPPAAQLPLGTVAASDETTPFAVVPEFGVKLGWRAGNSLHLTAGYSFLYWSRVRRAQDQYDLSPTLADRTTDVWVQGVNLGVEWRY
jgi:hypothetical protein